MRTTYLLLICYLSFDIEVEKYWAPTQHFHEDFISQIYHVFDHDIDLFYMILAFHFATQVAGIVEN